MNHRKHSRQLAFGYHILKRLIQDDALLNRTITKDNINELLDAKKFYEHYFMGSRFVEHFPMVFKLVERETSAAFKRMSKRLDMVHRYETQYPVSLWQDFKEDAPIFMYVSGTLAPLDRYADRIALFTTANSSDMYIDVCSGLIKQFKGHAFTVIQQFVTLMDNLLFLQLQQMSIPTVVLFRGPITKDLEAAIKKFNPRFKRGKKGLNIISVTGPFNDPMEDSFHIKLMNSLSKLSIILSDDVNDIKSIAVINNLAWKKPCFMPLLDAKTFASSELLYTLEHSEKFIDTILNLIR